jgi:hypothetical protein
MSDEMASLLVILATRILDLPDRILYGEIARAMPCDYRHQKLI